MKNSLLIPFAVLILATAGYFLTVNLSERTNDSKQLDATPYNVTLSGTYTCLPHADTSGPQTMECAFGLQTDDGDNYAVNFGASADAMSQFQSGAHITAEGFVVIKEALSSDHWSKYNMKGIFTITKMINPAPSQGKLDINVVCTSALAYMTFENSNAADKFIVECKAGEHPEVIERYKLQMGFGDGEAI